MGDFAAQGVRIVHKNKRIERFYRQWFKKIGGKDRSERFLNNLYKVGNVVINKQTGKISVKVAEKIRLGKERKEKTASDLLQEKK